MKPYIEWHTIQWLKEKGETKGQIWSLTSNETIQWLKEKGETNGELWNLTSNDRQCNGEKKKEKRRGKSETINRMTDNTMLNRKRRNQRGNMKPYIEWQTIQCLTEKEETKGEIWSLTSNDRQYNGLKKKGKYEALHRMTDNIMVKRKRRNQRTNLKPYIEWQTIQWLKEKGETKGEIWSLTSNDRQYNG
jgi:thioester reductase-like protein